MMMERTAEGRMARGPSGPADANAKRARRFSVPVAVAKAVRSDEALRKYSSATRNFKAGRHLLGISPYHAYELQNRVGARKRAIQGVLGRRLCEEMGLREMGPRQVVAVSDHLHAALLAGLDEKIAALGLPFVTSARKVINSGGAIKNHGGIGTYGGTTVYAYLMHQLQPRADDGDGMPSPEALAALASCVSTWQRARGLPVALLHSRRRIVTSAGAVVVPDLEAKANLRKIAGPELYERYRLGRMSFRSASTVELALLDGLYSLVRGEAGRIAPSPAHPAVAADLEASLDPANVIAVTDRGSFGDMLDVMRANCEAVERMEKDPDRLLDDADLNALFRIEYVNPDMSTGTAIWFRGELKEMLATYEDAACLIEALQEGTAEAPGEDLGWLAGDDREGGGTL